MDDGYGGRAEITLKLNLRVEQEFYFGQLPISDVKGFRDEATGQILTRGFTTGIVDPIEMRKTWLRINDPSDAPYPPNDEHRCIGRRRGGRIVVDRTF